MGLDLRQDAHLLRDVHRRPEQVDGVAAGLSKYRRAFHHGDVEATAGQPVGEDGAGDAGAGDEDSHDDTPYLTIGKHSSRSLPTDRSDMVATWRDRSRARRGASRTWLASCSARRVYSAPACRTSRDGWASPNPPSTTTSTRARSWCAASCNRPSTTASASSSSWRCAAVPIRPRHASCSKGSSTSTSGTAPICFWWSPTCRRLPTSV